MVCLGRTEPEIDLIEAIISARRFADPSLRLRDADRRALAQREGFEELSARLGLGL